jgi:hypothetical protein
VVADAALGPRAVHRQMLPQVQRVATRCSDTLPRSDALDPVA